MPTSVHIPKPLLAAVDRKARSLKISRNRLIVRALEREVAERDWPAGFFAGLPVMDEGTRRLLDDSMAAVRARRRSKGPPRL